MTTFWKATEQQFQFISCGFVCRYFVLDILESERSPDKGWECTVIRCTPLMMDKMKSLLQNAPNKGSAWETREAHRAGAATAIIIHPPWVE